MNAASAIDAEPRPRPREGASGRPRRRDRAAARTGSRDLVRPALAGLLMVSFLLRLWGIKQGLPYSYNADEATHFVPRAIDFFGHDLNPHYFFNPPGYSYLLYMVFELWFGSADAVRGTYVSDPTAVFVLARLVAAVLGTASVLFTYLAGARLIGRRAGLIAAAIMAVSFLPVFYSHLALNDVPTLAPVTMSLYGIAGVLRRGRTRDYVLAGVGIGLAAATKYTGGITLICLLAAFAGDAAGDGLRRAGPRLLLALLVAGLAFFAANPYALLDTSDFWSVLTSQASIAAGDEFPVKLGISQGSGIEYYLWTFTWGMGWLPALAALAGAALLALRRRIALALLLLPATVVFVVFMGEQQRFFGRWLMPVFPLVALLAAYASVELVRRVAGFIDPAGRRAGVRVVLGVLAVVLLVGQSLVADVRGDSVLSRPDTRSLARAWLVSHIPVGSRVVIEPMVPDEWALDVGRPLAATRTGERWYRYPTWLSSLDPAGRPLPTGQYRYVYVDEYERNLYPALLDDYVTGGYCWVVIGSYQAGRAFAQPAAVPAAIDYYGHLAHRAKLVFHVSPFAAGAHPVPFNFDWSIDYYPRQYARPGPEISVYRLTDGSCAPPVPLL